MRDGEIRDLAAQQERHWWFRARRRILAAVLREVRWERAPRALVDLGCGAGIDLDRLHLGDGLCVGIDRASETLRVARAREGAAFLVRGDGARVPLRGERFDLALALDVVEHLDDDAGALAEARRILRPGGRLVVTAPACPWLWCEHDVALAHRRRYRRRDLLRKIQAAGFEVERETFFNTILFPPAAAYRLARGWWRGLRGARGEALSDTRRLGNRGGWLLERLFGLESRWLARHRLPFGLSLLVVARRR